MASTAARGSVHDFWNDRGTLAETAGTQDLIAKQLEMAAIARHIQDGMRVCEFGCGNGITAIWLAKYHDIHMDCLDFAEEMIEAAEEAAREAGVSDRVRFEVADVRNEAWSGAYDVVYTERMLVNLPDWYAQEQAIRYLARQVKPGGSLVLCENSVQGLERINELREMVGLDPVISPWHNRYLDDREMETIDVPDLHLLAVEPYSATYYFLSRVVNAWLANEQGEEPAYDAPVSKLALDLPAIGDCAQGKLWVFERSGS